MHERHFERSVTVKHRILLADDHKIVRDGLRTMLELEADIEVAAEAQNGRMAVQLVRKLAPDVVIMDINMPDLNGIDATRQIMAEQPGVKVIALSMHSQKQFVEGMLRAGVSAYLLKDTAFEELVKAVRIVLSGKKYLSPDVTDIVVQDYVQPPADRGISSSELTLREREVLQLIAEGRSTREIASALFISVKTVESHRKNIMQKLDLYTVAELTKYAIRTGLTSVEK
jgi:two-component system response regulator NreC